MMQEAEAYFELRKVYSQDGSGGLPRQRTQAEQSAAEEHQNATWANEGKLLGTPLQAPPDPIKEAARAQLTAKNHTGTCPRCGGTDHVKKNCPNEVAEKDHEWQRKPEVAKANPCRRCNGIGHWSYHHKMEDKGDNAGGHTTQGVTHQKPEVCRF